MTYNKMSNIRNYCHIAHVDVGKTTLSERILFYAGKIHKLGEVHDGDTVLDFDPREQKRGITINAAVTNFSWTSNVGQSIQINLIDTPGHCDLEYEVERSLRVSDGAICLLDASQGVEPQTEQVWRQADKYNVARIIFINKMDKVGADWNMCLASLDQKLGIKVIPIQLPVIENNNFIGIIDLIEMKMISFDVDSLGKDLISDEIPENMIVIAQRARELIIDTLSEVDDEILSTFIEGGSDSISLEKIYSALRLGTINCKFYPVLCGSAFKNKGVQLLLDAVCNFLPAPSDLKTISGLDPISKQIISRKLSSEEAFSALVFKVVNDRNGTLTYLRVYSGSLSTGSLIYNCSKQRLERISKILLVHGNRYQELKQAEAGSIVAVAGLKKTVTGDTLCDANALILLENIVTPEPVVEISIEPKTQTDLDKLSLGLQKLLLEDPSLCISNNSDTGQTILKGMGELHLEVVLDKLQQDYKIEVNTGKPQVSYRETLTSVAIGNYTHKHQSGGHGQYAKVILEVSPGYRGSGFVFESKVVGGTISKEYIPAIEKGIKNTLEKGIISDNPIIDVHVSVLDGDMHCVDSSSLAFEIAGSIAFEQAFKAANPIILEPLMLVELVVPMEFMGTVIGIVSGRSGQIKESSDRGNAKVIIALMPLRKIFGLTHQLRSGTQGRVSPSMKFDCYEKCPLSIEELKI